MYVAPILANAQATTNIQNIAKYGTDSIALAWDWLSRSPLPLLYRFGDYHTLYGLPGVGARLVGLMTSCST